MVARMWRLAGGRGRPACCTSACTSAELSSSTRSGCFPPLTAFSSESPSWVPAMGCRAGDARERRKSDGCPMTAPLGFTLEWCVASKHTTFLPLTRVPST